MMKKYSTLMFLNDLKIGLQKIVSSKNLWRGKLTDEKLGILLGQSKNHIRKKRFQIKKNPDYVISLENLNKYSENLVKKFKDEAESVFQLIEKYQNLNEIPKAIYGIYYWHPDLKIDYFKIINTKKKAYWLGWLYAEAWLSKHGNNIRFGVEIHKDDEKYLIDKFAKIIGFNLEHKETEIRREGELTDYVRIRFVSDEFARHLINHGFIIGKEKSKLIELPYLKSRELYLAFLLGYYDGDGKVGTTVITSGSIRFIRQVKEHFNIPYKIWRTDSEWEGVGYNIYLGMDLMREMLVNYKYSLPRKRTCFE